MRWNEEITLGANAGDPGFEGGEVTGRDARIGRQLGIGKDCAVGGGVRVSDEGLRSKFAIQNV